MDPLEVSELFESPAEVGLFAVTNETFGEVQELGPGLAFANGEEDEANARNPD
jgi:hypothetical protein